MNIQSLDQVSQIAGKIPRSIKNITITVSSLVALGVGIDAYQKWDHADDMKNYDTMIEGLANGKMKRVQNNFTRSNPGLIVAVNGEDGNCWIGGPVTYSNGTGFLDGGDGTKEVVREAQKVWGYPKTVICKSN